MDGGRKYGRGVLGFLNPSFSVVSVFVLRGAATRELEIICDITAETGSLTVMKAQKGSKCVGHTFH